MRKTESVRFFPGLAADLATTRHPLPVQTTGRLKDSNALFSPARLSEPTLVVNLRREKWISVATEWQCIYIRSGSFLDVVIHSIQPLTGRMHVPWTRPTRFVSTDNRLLRGEPMLPHSDFDPGSSHRTNAAARQNHIRPRCILDQRLQSYRRDSLR